MPTDILRGLVIVECAAYATMAMIALYRVWHRKAEGAVYICMPIWVSVSLLIVSTIFAIYATIEMAYLIIQSTSLSWRAPLLFINLFIANASMIALMNYIYPTKPPRQGRTTL